jgi:acetyl esterase/lipase
VFSLCSIVAAQESGAAQWATLFANHYALHSDLVYGQANRIPLKLDVWEQQQKDQLVPTVVYIHGGGWVFGAKAGAEPLLMPYLQRGWNAVNVEYRMASESLAPAAVEDTRCALRWVFRNASKYHFDTNRIVLTGHSAGGHLALITGLLTEESGFDNNCPADTSMGDVPMRVAAIVNWYGITDVSDLLVGSNRKTYAVAWLGGQTNREEIARRVSPPGVRTSRNTADYYYPRGPRSDGTLLSGGSATRCLEKGLHSKPTGHDQRRCTWKLQRC